MFLIASPVVQVPQKASTLWLLDDDDDDDVDDDDDDDDDNVDDDDDDGYNYFTEGRSLKRVDDKDRAKASHS
jgi:hypothetical protein